jgi:hypothetical protein
MPLQQNSTRLSGNDPRGLSLPGACGGLVTCIWRDRSKDNIEKIETLPIEICTSRFLVRTLSMVSTRSAASAGWPLPSASAWLFDAWRLSLLKPMAVRHPLRPPAPGPCPTLSSIATVAPFNPFCPHTVAWRPAISAHPASHRALC